YLIRVRQARRIGEYRTRHAERAGALRHHAGERLLVAGNGFRNHDGDVVRRARDDGLDGILDADRLTGLEAELGGRLPSRVGGGGEFGVEFETAGLELREEQIEG